MTKVVVIIPTLINKEGGYEALASIQSPFDTFWMPVIIDNWRENRSIAASWNMGIEIGLEYDPDYLLIANDDVLLSPWTIAGLINTFTKPPVDSLAMVTASNVRGNTKVPEDIFSIEIPSLHQEWAENPDFSCFMMTPNSFNKIGPFDENFIPAYFEDNDYHRRINLLGYKAISTNQAPFYHYGSVTQNFNEYVPVVNADNFIANRDYYIQKWGGEVGKEQYVHPYNDTSVSPNRWKYLRK